MTEYQVAIDGREYRVRVLSDPSLDVVQVEVDGKPVSVRVRGAELRAEAPQPTQAPEAHSFTPGIGAKTTRVASYAPNRVPAPLPGAIKSIAVQTGQSVAVGDELLVIEAMKMDNHIRAARAGVIGRVFVTQGNQVSHGDALVEFAAETT
jgi:biotin carboxyl carrier protein